MLLVVAYLLNLLHALSHTHEEHTHSFSHLTAVYSDIVSPDTDHDHWDSKAHDCLACQFKTKPHTGGITLSTPALAAAVVYPFESTRSSFSTTPTQCLARAPPVA